MRASAERRSAGCACDNAYASVHVLVCSWTFCVKRCFLSQNWCWSGDLGGNLVHANDDACHLADYDAVKDCANQHRDADIHDFTRTERIDITDPTVVHTAKTKYMELYQQTPCKVEVPRSPHLMGRN